MSDLDRYAELHEKNIRGMISNPELEELHSLYEKLKKAEEDSKKYEKLIYEIQDQPHAGTCNVVVNELLKQNQKTPEDIEKIKKLGAIEAYVTILQDGDPENEDSKKILDTIDEIIERKT